MRVEGRALTPVEAGRLTELETTVERGLTTFVEVGQALMAIRDERLYRVEHETFEDYCREQWRMSKAYANRTIAAAEVVSAMAPIGAAEMTPIGVTGPNGLTPANEAQARALAPLKDDAPAMAAALEEASADGKPTAASIAEAVERRLPGPKTAEKQARERGEAVLSSDGYWYTGKEEGDMRYGNVIFWASMLEREPFPAPGELEVPYWMQESFLQAVRELHGLLTGLLENGWKEHPSDPR